MSRKLTSSLFIQSDSTSVSQSIVNNTIFLYRNVCYYNFITETKCVTVRHAKNHVCKSSNKKKKKKRKEKKNLEKLNTDRYSLYIYIVITERCTNVTNERCINLFNDKVMTKEMSCTNRTIKDYRVYLNYRFTRNVRQLIFDRSIKRKLGMHISVIIKAKK